MKKLASATKNLKDTNTPLRAVKRQVYNNCFKSVLIRIMKNHKHGRQIAGLATKERLPLGVIEIDTDTDISWKSYRRRLKKL